MTPSTNDSAENNTDENDPAQELVEQAIKTQFKNCEFPEHVEESLHPFLELAQTETNLTQDEWQTVFESLATKVEYGEASWITQQN